MPGKKAITVTGPIHASRLGFCHCHEHLFIANGQSAIINPDLCMDDFEKSAAELDLFRSAGGRSIVDAQPIGCGRMERFLHDASVRSRIQIIASTGFHKLDFYPWDHWIHSIDISELAGIFISEIHEGMFVDANKGIPAQQIPVCAGIIKTASGAEGIAGRYRELYRAAARASIQAGAPLLCHVEPGADALDIVYFLTSQGVPPASIILCHLDRKVEDIAAHLAVAKTGVYFEFDTIGRSKYHSDKDEADFIVKMIEHGCEDRILLGLDTTRARMKSYSGGIGLDYLLRSFIPLLEKHGVSNAIIKKFTVSNPSRALLCDMTAKDKAVL